MDENKLGLRERLGLIKSIWSSKTKQIAIDNVTSSLYKMMPQYGEPPKNNIANWIKTYNLNPRMNPVHQIASDISCSEYKILNGDKVIENHPIKALLQNPCDDIAITESGLFYITQVYLMLPSGEAFWLKERNGAGIPTELWAIPPNWVTELPSKVNNYFKVQPSGNMDARPIEVPPQDIVYFKKLNVVNPYLRGIGRVEAVGDEIETDEYMAKFNKKFFYNNAIPNMVGMMPGADSTAIERAQENWQQKYGGYNNAHKMAWLGWDAKIQVLKETTKEMDFVESRKYLRDTTNQHFCIPPEIFGILENSNRATIDSAYYLYAKNVLRKELKSIQDTINRQLMIDYKDNCMLVYDNIVPEDAEFDLKRSNEGLSRGAIMLDEWRVANGFDELEGDKGKVFYIPSNVIVSKSPVETPTPTPQEQKKNEETDLTNEIKGGAGSGNFGHSGRPGVVGGSGSGGSGGIGNIGSSGGSGSVSGGGGGGSSGSHESESEYFSDKSKTKAEIVAQKLGVDTETASNYIESVKGYTSENYSDIRSASINGRPPSYVHEAKDINDFIDKSPKFEGQVYRGITLTPDQHKNLLQNGTNKEITMLGISSWSSDKGVASKFASDNIVSGADLRPVVFRVTNKTGASVTHLSKFENEKEVIQPSTSKYKIRTVAHGSDGVTRVHLEEV